MRILMMGAPGAGKGTQAAIMSERFKIPHISTGDLFRAAAEKPTELGQQIYILMKNGRLIPDEITNKILEERLLEHYDVEAGFILDGYPRTVNQAINLDVVLNWRHMKLDRAINIVVPADYLIERAQGRRICKKCGATYHIKFNPPKTEHCDTCGGELYQRADDNAETMRNRLAAYETSTRPLIDYYKKAGIYAEVDGTRSIDAVTAQLLEVVS